MPKDPAMTSRHETTVLVVDDEVPVRRAVARMLAADGFTIAEAGTSESALRVFEMDSTEIVVLDLLLDEGAAWQKLVKEMIDLDPEVAIVVYSAHVDKQAALDALHLRVDAVVEKPDAAGLRRAVLTAWESLEEVRGARAKLRQTCVRVEAMLDQMEAITRAARRDERSSPPSP